jgi:hypothetical protein
VRVLKESSGHNSKNSACLIPKVTPSEEALQSPGFADLLFQLGVSLVVSGPDESDDYRADERLCFLKKYNQLELLVKFTIHYFQLVFLNLRVAHREKQFF